MDCTVVVCKAGLVPRNTRRPQLSSEDTGHHSFAPVLRPYACLQTWRTHSWVARYLGDGFTAGDGGLLRVLVMRQLLGVPAQHRLRRLKADSTARGTELDVCVASDECQGCLTTKEP